MRGLGQMKIEQRQIKAKKARVWLSSLRLWMWRWQTLSPVDRAIFYKQPEVVNYLTEKVDYHTLWVQKHPLGRKEDYQISDIPWSALCQKAFDAPYLLTMSAENGGWVHYQLLPASMHGHRVNVVSHFIEVNEKEPPLEIWSGNFHCIHCKLMGSEETMKEYTCSGD